ncbi:Uncharacterised protein [Yersinia pseudotuberculosis]|uniref:Uncharacterized protein n=1 Tax=Yersinia pseudotuberculosis TaxID=633 RepID=A0A380SDG2_YERPU|nr:hypothetical protein YPSE1_45340 [Yersinia pseudotuberculosis]SUQ39486.1 Uncharacterised protein [Yersinia pseudotuberculosis]
MNTIIDTIRGYGFNLIQVKSLDSEHLELTDPLSVLENKLCDENFIFYSLLYTAPIVLCIK